MINQYHLEQGTWQPDCNMGGWRWGVISFEKKKMQHLASWSTNMPCYNSVTQGQICLQVSDIIWK